MRATNWSHIRDWLQRIVFRWPSNVSKRLLPIYLFIWLLIITIIVAAFVYLFKYGLAALTSNVLAMYSGLATILLASISRLLYNYLGDAGRYLDPSPVNIAERQSIRADGIKLLKNLHESEKYDRIVLVGHSLGSVIAYDLVKFLWNEYYKSFKAAKFNEVFEDSNREVFHSVSASEKAGKYLDGSNEQVDAFQKAQGESYKYLKAIGNKWLITDLITLGSPLTHAGHLLVQENGLFDKLKNQREYPTCPPYLQPPDKTNIISSQKFNIEGHNHPFTIKRFNHSSPFAVTKWTNIYYTSDFIGGPLQGVFGNGIKDLAIRAKNKFFLYPRGHTEYWEFKNKDNILDLFWEIMKGSV